MKRILIVITLGLLIPATPLARAHAEEVTIANNGTGSSNAVSTDSSTQTSVQQTNIDTSKNSLTTDAVSGHNTTAGNQGSATITTGKIDTSVQVNNTGNGSSMQESCCQNSTLSTAISGNGANSTNIIANNSNSSNSVTVNNSASVTTIISGNVNTGGNKAVNNNGSVTIQTGTVSVEENVQSGPLNVAKVSLPSSDTSDDPAIAISDNGKSSLNSVTYYARNDSNIFVNNASTVINDISWKLNTGDNFANGNVGTVDILTGDVVTKTHVHNGPMNITMLQLLCCPKPSEQQSPPTPHESIGGPSTSNTNNGGSSSVGQVLGVSTGGILPVTGNAWLFFATIGNMILLTLGLLVRLRSGRSPNAAI